MTNRKSKTNLLIVGAIAFAQFLLHVFTNGNYGMFRDEFYYIECSKNLAWGYVDHPPLSILLLTISRFVTGDSVHAIRILPALSGSLLIVLTALITRELGGKRSAQILSALGVALAPGFLGMTGFYSMNAYDLLFWAAGFLLVIRILKTGNSKLWLVFGALMGLGLQNKISVLFFAFSLVLGLFFTPYRKMLLDKYLWLGGFLAIVLFLPNIIWQSANGWPTLEFMATAKRYKIADIPPLQFFISSVLEIGPANFIVWMTGLVFFLISRQNKQYRLWGLFYVITFVFLVVQKSKPYYLYAAYPVLFAGGAIAFEKLSQKKNRRWVMPIILANTIIGGAISLPLALPILPVNKFISYQSALGIKVKNAENSELGALPQYFADRFGWENMAKTISAVYDSLPAEQQQDCIVVTDNYGEAGAINYFSHDYHLPPAKSQHNNYYLWGPGKVTEKTVYLIIGQSREDLENTFIQVKAGPVIRSQYAIPYENNLQIYICRGLKRPMEQAWKDGKHFI
ncbi:MAG: phospholipid carrier-dependent glycosyltransferase [Actinobacteria bacterium]|nr:phospholipid carrier-dependent glycosyltransferase [Actinomycetota bacterium]